MYEIPEGENVTPGMKADALRAEMDDTAIRCCYAVNADRADDAHELSQRYFELLGEWNVLVRELAGATYLGSDPQ